MEKIEEGKSLTMILKEIQNKKYDSSQKEEDRPINFLKPRFDNNRIEPKAGWDDNVSLEFNESWKEDQVTKFKFLNIDSKENEDEEEKTFKRNASFSDDNSDNEGNLEEECKITTNTIQILKRDFEFPIQKVYNNIKVEELKGKGWTKGHEFEDLIKIDQKILAILEEAANEFPLSPSKSQDILRENKIIGYPSEHFAMFLYCQPIDLDIKTQYLFNSRDDFAIKTRHKFIELFTFRDCSMKEFILSILFKCMPPKDVDKRQIFFRYFCEEYCDQNSDKYFSPDNVEIILSCILFFIEKKQKKLKHSRVTLEQFVDYAGEQGQNIISIDEAQRYHKEIQDGTFLPSELSIKLGVEGKYSTDRNVNFIRKVKKFGWRATPGDIFFLERTKFYKLELRGTKIRKKEICFNQDETKLLWYNEGKNRAHSIRVADITDAEIGITETFKRYCDVPEFQELIKDDTLCLSIKTSKRSVDFYGNNAKDVQTWYDRLKGIAEANIEEKIKQFESENREPSLLEFNFDKVKEVVWEAKVIPNWQRYFDCLAFPLVPINYKDIKIQYQIPVASKPSKEGEIPKEKKMKDIYKTVSFTDLIMSGIPCKIRALIYPIIIPNSQSITSNYYDILQEEYNETGKISKQLRARYDSLVTDALRNYKDMLNKTGFDYKEIKEKIIKMLYILFEIHRKDLYFSGRDIVMICFHFAFYIVSDYDAYKCFANIVLGNSLLVNNFQRKGVDESEMFNTIVMNTVCISEIRAKTVSDAATEFIIKKLQTDFKDWGLTAITRIEKSNLKLNDYINGLRMSFLTNELPLEYTSIIFDHYILKGEYSLISTIIYYLKLKWGEMRTIKNKGLTVTNLFSPSKSLNLYSKSYIKSYEDLQKKFKAKMQFKNILDIQVKLSSN